MPKIALWHQYRLLLWGLLALNCADHGHAAHVLAGLGVEAGALAFGLLGEGGGATHLAHVAPFTSFVDVGYFLGAVASLVARGKGCHGGYYCHCEHYFFHGVEVW